MMTSMNVEMSIDATPRVVAPATASRTTPRSPRSRPYLRRRVMVLGLSVLLVSALTVGLGRVGAQAVLEDPVAGHVVVAPGETLWDVAVATAPDGVDPRRQVRELRALNGIDGAHLDAWAVILIPAR